MTTATRQTIDLVESLSGADFWGILTLKFQRGQVIHITKEESIQPVPNNRSSHDQHSN